MRPYALRVLVGLGSVGVACLVIFIVEHAGIDTELFAERARSAGAIGLILLVLLTIVHAVDWPKSVSARMSSTANLISKWFSSVLSGFGWSTVLRAVAIVLLLSAHLSHTRDFFVLLRWFVTGCAALTAAIARRRQQPAWLWLGAMVAVLFNPLAEIHLSRPTWEVVDPVVAAWFAASIFTVRERYPRDPSASRS
jgi:hypothetical protein